MQRGNNLGRQKFKDVMEKLRRDFAEKTSFNPSGHHPIIATIVLRLRWWTRTLFGILLGTLSLFYAFSLCFGFLHLFLFLQ